MKKTSPSLTNSRPVFREFKKSANEHLLNLGAPHVDSFNHMFREGLQICAKYITPVQFQTPLGEKIKLSVEAISISKPKVPLDVINVKNRQIFPVECRQRKCTYKAMCHVTVGWSVDGIDKLPIEHELGEVPIMVKSEPCNLHGLTPEEMVSRGEHENDWGGYFIVKGHEKIIRMLLMNRRNYPISLKRGSWKDKGLHFTDMGVMVRSVREDETSVNNILHYLSNGTAKLMFAHGRMVSYLPVCLLLKCLTNYPDITIYKKLVAGFENDQYYLSCVLNMLREVHEENLHTQEQCKDYLGELFRSRCSELPPWATNSEVTDFLLNERIMIHLGNHEDKFNLIVFMVQKLFQFAQDKCKTETVDGVMMQEVLLGGHCYQKFLIDRIDLWLSYVKRSLIRRCSEVDSIVTPPILNLCFKQAGGVEKPMETFLATGNAPSRTGLGLMQSSGLVVMAENINRMRYMSHFRAVHRGSFFTTMRTTEVRQLLPDAWGFICPVHTPDGAPCGLLNHLTVNCKLSMNPDKKLLEKVPTILISLGMIPLDSPVFDSKSKTYIVMLDGKILGHIRMQDAQKIANKLRSYKVENVIPEMMEIAFVPYKKNGQFSGLFLFTGPARMMRPVKNLALGKIEYIGSFEQVYMDIAIDPKEAYEITTHLELSKTDFMSNLANLIPMPDCNQSPRNMYQCQMGKQTMGTPCHNFSLQAENKLYRLQTPGTPLFRPVHHDNIDLDDFAMGTNAIVAVISYTGYDMEDAMVINKMALERGFAYGSIYKSQFVELTGSSYFARDPNDETLVKYLDNDGLPHPGSKIKHRSVLYCYFDMDESIFKVVKNEEKEEAVIDNVRYCGHIKVNAPKMICITFRIPRAPTIGDKFASRAGQKGICSRKYPTEDLPFTETGIIPDIVFNPHGFPSRMTIAMMIETMAGKSAALHGLVHDATPFRFSEKHTAIDYFGKLLEKGGYNYYGTEKMYSGVDGREMMADIFFGVVHYQRLRHMVFDKWQVRSTGPVDVITQQPIKGRKRGGGVRFGEMERDSLISHGAAYLLQDRLFESSDKTTVLVCENCGSILSPINRVIKRSGEDLNATPAKCRLCDNDSRVGYIQIPYAYKYLVTELSALNINAKFKLTSV